VCCRVAAALRCCRAAAAHAALLPMAALLPPCEGIEDLREKREGMMKQIADEEAEKMKARVAGWAE
jgi:hypothetical protein